ncbi:hypothetical protein D3C80_2042660 [compost metagenome]
MVRLAAGEILQLCFGVQLFLERRLDGGLGQNLSGNRLLLNLLLGYGTGGRATKKQGHECEGHEGCEAI